MPKRIGHARPRNRSLLRARLVAAIAVRASLLLLAVLAASYLPHAARGVLETTTARATAPLISATGVEVAHSAPSDLRLSNHTFRIDYECTAFRIVLLFGTAVAVTPVSRTRRLQGVLIGVPIILAANLFRLVGLAGVSELRPEHFHVLHAYTFQAFMVVFAGGAWALWLRASRNDWLPAWSQ